MCVVWRRQLYTVYFIDWLIKGVWVDAMLYKFGGDSGRLKRSRPAIKDEPVLIAYRAIAVVPGEQQVLHTVAVEITGLPADICASTGAAGVVVAVQGVVPPDRICRRSMGRKVPRP